MTKPIPTPEELQTLCEQLIACPHLKLYKCGSVYTVRDPRYYGDVLEIERQEHCFSWATYSVKLTHISIAVSNPRKLYKLATEHYSNLVKNETEEEIKKAVCCGIKHLNDEYRKEQE
jgi:hypothetical protein